jgi:DNA-binding response OmpR family regulator
MLKLFDTPEIDRLAEIAAMTVGDNPFAEIDRERHQIRRLDGSWSRFTPNAWAAFSCLHRRRGHVVEDDELAAAVWSAQRPAAEQSLRMVVREVRRALVGTRWAIATHRQLGRELVLIGPAGERR